MPLVVKQTSRPISTRRWDWSVWIDGEGPQLDEIAYVEYVLHPSFPEPIVRTKDRDAKFRLDTSGWGEFELGVRVRNRSGDETEVKHWVVLGHDGESVTTLVPRQIFTSFRRGPPQKPATKRRNVFLSGSATDVTRLDAIGKALEARGFQVLNPHDVKVGEDWHIAIDRMVDEADVAVLLTSGRVGSWNEREIDTLKDRSVPVVSVLVGPNARKPRSLRDATELNLKSDEANEVDMAAERLTDLFKAGK